MGTVGDIADLPAVTACPRCRKSCFTLFQDTRLTGIWCSCSDCGLRGKPLEILAELFDRSLEDTVAYTAERLHLPWPSLDLELYERYRREQNLWTEILQAGTPVASLRAQRVQLGEPPLEESLWQQRGGRVLGVASTSLLSACYGKLPGRRQEWLLTPLYDLPGRIAGYLTFHGEPAFLCVGPTPGGLFVRQGTTGIPIPALEHYLFFFDRPDWLFPAYFRQVQESSWVLPVAGLLPQAPVPFLDDPRARILLVSEITHDILRHAAGLNARVYLFDRLFRNRDVVTELHSAVYLARHWRDVCEEHLMTLPSAERYSFLRRLRLSPDEQQRIAAKCRPPGSPAEFSLPYRAPIRQLIVLDGKTIEERSEGWYLTTGECVCAPAIRLETAVYTQHPERAYYRGVVQGKDYRLPFTVEQAQLSADTAGWLEGFLRKNCRTLILNTRYRRKLLSIALQMYEPTVHHLNCWFGFHEATRRVELPAGTVDLAARCVTERLPEETALWPEDYFEQSFDPAFEPPDESPRFPLTHRALYYFVLDLVLWSVRQLTRPLLGWTPRSFLCPDAPWMDTFLQTLGYRPTDLVLGRTPEKPAGKLPTARRWRKDTRPSGKWDAWLCRPDDQTLLIVEDEALRNYLLLSRVGTAWDSVFRMPALLDVTTAEAVELGVYARKLLWFWLLNAQELAQHEPTGENVLQARRLALKQLIPMLPRAVFDSNAYLFRPVDQAECLRRLLSELRDSGRLREVPLKFSNLDYEQLVRVNSETVWFHPQSLMRVLLDQTHIELSCEEVQRHASSSKMFKASYALHSQEGVLVTKHWLDNTKIRLRLVGD